MVLYIQSYNTINDFILNLPQYELRSHHSFSAQVHSLTSFNNELYSAAPR
jgi:hypothetical protein